MSEYLMVIGFIFMAVSFFIYGFNLDLLTLNQMIFKLFFIIIGSMMFAVGFISIKINELKDLNKKETK